MFCFRGRTLQYLLFCAGSFATMQCGFNAGWPSYALPQLLTNTSTIPLTNDDGSWIASALPIGTICGSILTALTLDMFGRKTMLLVGTLPMCGTWLVIAFARTSWELGVAKFVAGVSDGIIFSCFPVYLAEVSDPTIRGFLISGTATFFTVGLFVTNLLGTFLSLNEVAIIFSLMSLGILICLFIPESPYFYMIKENINKAKISMEMFNVNGDVNSIKKAINEQKGINGNMLELFTHSSNRKSLCVVVISRVFQQFTGSTSFIFYAQTIFQESKEDVSPIIFIGVYYLLQVIVLATNAILVDKIGRRPLLVASISIAAVALFIISVYFTLKNITEIRVTDYSWYPVFGLFLYIIGYNLGLQNVLFLLVSEIFPLHVKSGAVAIISVTYGIISIGVTKFFQYTKDEFGMHVPFITFAISSMGSIPFFIFCIPETKKKTLEDIEKDIRLKQSQK